MRWLQRFARSERIDAIAEKCVAAGFTMCVVQEAQRLHTLMEFVVQGIGVAIIPDPFCRPAGVVFRKLEDLDLAANLRLTWLRHNDSALLKELSQPHARLLRNLSLSAQSGD